MSTSNFESVCFSAQELAALCAGELLPVTVMQRQAEDTGNLWHWPGGSAAPYSVEGGEQH